MEWLGFALVALLALGGTVFSVLHRRRKQQAFERLVLRDSTLQPTGQPLGLDRRRLSAHCASLPEGDRRFGFDYAVQGPLRATMSGREAQFECAAFRWWWEQRQQNGKHGHRYQRQATTVALVRLPAAVPTPVHIRPESVLGRLGVTRGGQQLESSEFNRRFRVECEDDRLAVMLLDADMQAALLDAFGGRSVELTGDLLLLEGAPDHRDDSLAGAIGELPAVRQDVARLIALLPDQLWRHLRSSAGSGWAASGPEVGHG